MAKRYTSKQDRATLFLACDGKCKCGVKLDKTNTIIEHGIPLALGGTDTLGNKYLQCRDCANMKTYGGASKASTAGTDIANIWKVKRLRGELKPKMKRNWPPRKMQSRPWPK